MHLVTCIYGYNQQSIYGGRGYELPVYFSALRNVANLQLPLVLYCDPEKVEETENELRPYFGTRLYVIGTPLQDFKYHDTYIEWKKTFVSYTYAENTRNEMLCLRKYYFLIDTINNPLFAKESSFMWIDAGLFHDGLFPRRMGGTEYIVRFPDEHYYPLNPNSMFTPTLGAAIAEQGNKDKLFFCGKDGLDFPSRDNPKYISLLQEVTGREISYITPHLVGGMFGGNKKNILDLYNMYDTIVHRSITSKIYLLEESVFSGLHTACPELFNVNKFEFWGHCCEERHTLAPYDGDSFYKIFKGLIN